ncbi:hypothetical protein M2138_000217 [Dysgonomonadaceae bacterium PH5-43]|nr:hypothetical protein [Dysgonomonadaceae bacterium PH5-43]
MSETDNTQKQNDNMIKRYAKKQKKTDKNEKGIVLSS